MTWYQDNSQNIDCVCLSPSHVISHHKDVKIFFFFTIYRHITVSRYKQPMLSLSNLTQFHWSLARYVILRVAHAPGIPGTFSPPPRVSDPDMHHGTCMTHLPWCIPGSLISGFLWSRWRGKRSQHSGACAIRNFTYLVKGPWYRIHRWVMSGHHWPNYDHVARRKNFAHGSHVGTSFCAKIPTSPAFGQSYDWLTHCK